MVQHPPIYSLHFKIHGYDLILSLNGVVLFRVTKNHVIPPSIAISECLVHGRNRLKVEIFGVDLWCLENVLNKKDGEVLLCDIELKQQSNLEASHEGVHILSMGWSLPSVDKIQKSFMNFSRNIIEHPLDGIPLWTWERSFDLDCPLLRWSFYSCDQPKEVPEQEDCKQMFFYLQKVWDTFQSRKLEDFIELQALKLKDLAFCYHTNMEQLVQETREELRFIFTKKNVRLVELPLQGEVHFLPVWEGNGWEVVSQKSQPLFLLHGDPEIEGWFLRLFLAKTKTGWSWIR